MRICHFTSTFLPRIGGVETVVSNLAQYQHNLGHEVLVLTPKIRGIENAVPCPYRVVNYARPSSKRFLTRQVLIRLLWEHWKKPFDILHCHSAYPHGYVSTTFNQLTGVPVVITPHGPTDIMREERIRRHPVLERRLAKGLRKAAAITAISSDIQKEVLSIGMIPREKVWIIPNGVMLSDYEGIPAIDLGFPYVLAMGRMVPQKGFDFLIKVFAGLAPSLGGIHLVMAGEGIFRRDYERLTHQLGAEKTIHFVGLVQGKQKISLLKGAEFFLCPSRSEPFGIVLLEALAAGLPVIANHVGGIPDIITQGQEGYLVAPNNEGAWKQAITELAYNPDLKQQMGLNALDRVKLYDWSVIGDRYMQIYFKAIETNKNKKQSQPAGGV